MKKSIVFIFLFLLRCHFGFSNNAIFELKCINSRTIDTLIPFNNLIFWDNRSPNNLNVFESELNNTLKTEKPIADFLLGCSNSVFQKAKKNNQELFIVINRFKINQTLKTNSLSISVDVYLKKEENYHSIGEFQTFDETYTAFLKPEEQAIEFEKFVSNGVYNFFHDLAGGFHFLMQLFDKIKG